MARERAANSGWNRPLEFEGFQSDTNSVWIASWHANVLLVQLGVPLSARKELPDNLGPQNDSQMNDNRKGTVDFWGCWGGL